MISLTKLQDAIEASWSSDTCFDASEWSPENPARGQCATTALVVQYFLGGELEKMTTVFEGQLESHYYNVLPDGTKLDLAGKQYPADQELTPSEVNLRGFASVRDKMMHEPGTKKRYEILLERVKQKLG